MIQRLALSIEECTNNVDKVAEHFGECSKFIICEIDSHKKVSRKETYFNPLNSHDAHERQLPSYIQQFDVNTIIAGFMGGKTIAKFHELGIEVITAPGLVYEEAINLFLRNKLNGYNGTSDHD